MTSRVLWRTSSATLIKIEGSVGTTIIPMAGILQKQSEAPDAADAVTVTGIVWSGTGGTCTISRSGVIIASLSNKGSLGFDEPFYDNGYQYSDINVTTTGSPMQIWLTLHRAGNSSMVTQIAAIFAKYSTSGTKTWLHDFGDKASLYQDASGTIPVTASGQPIGLVLDKSQGLVRGPELVVNGDFSAGSTGWSPSTGWTFSNNQLVATNVAQNSFTFTTVGVLTAGKWYEIQGTCKSITTGSWKLLLEGGANVFGDKTTTGTFRGIVLANTSGNVYIWANSVLTASFDDISVKELPGNHALQLNQANSPTYTEAAGVAYASWDGVNDAMSTGTIDLTATDKMTVVAGVRKQVDTATGIIVELGATALTTNGTFALAGPAGAASNFGFYLNGSALRTTNIDATAPGTFVVAGQYDIAQAAATEISPRLNGAPATASGSGGDAGTGNFSNQPLYIGSRATTSAFFNGLMTVNIGIGATITPAELAILEAYAIARNVGL